MTRRLYCPQCEHCRLTSSPVPEGRIDTSRKAAQVVRDRLRETEATILGLLRSPILFGGAPKTANKIAQLSGIPLLTVRPRLSYLRDIGKVKDSGQRARISARTTAIAWEIVP